jgi:hypothetical protein
MVAAAVAAANSMLRLFVRAFPFATTSHLDDEQPLSVINTISGIASVDAGRIAPLRSRTGPEFTLCGFPAVAQWPFRPWP